MQTLFATTLRTRVDCEHSSVEQTLAWLRRAVLHHPAYGEEGVPPSVVEALGALRDHLGLLFAWEESRVEPYDSAGLAVNAPQLIPAAERLWQLRDELFLAAAELADHADDSLREDADGAQIGHRGYCLSDCQRDFRRFEELYRRYLRHEADVVSSMLYEETGIAG
jgi:hypothetical protein